MSKGFLLNEMDFHNLDGANDCEDYRPFYVGETAYNHRTIVKELNNNIVLKITSLHDDNEDAIHKPLRYIVSAGLNYGSGFADGKASAETVFIPSGIGKPSDYENQAEFWKVQKESNSREKRLASLNEKIAGFVAENSPKFYNVLNDKTIVSILLEDNRKMAEKIEELENSLKQINEVSKTSSYDMGF